MISAQQQQLCSYKNPAKQAQRGFLKSRQADRMNKLERQTFEPDERRNNKSESNTSSASSSGYLSHNNTNDIKATSASQLASGRAHYLAQADERQLRPHQVPSINHFVGSQYYHTAAQRRQFRLANATKPPTIPAFLDIDGDDICDPVDDINRFGLGERLIDDHRNPEEDFEATNDDDEGLSFGLNLETGQVYAFGVEDVCVDSVGAVHPGDFGRQQRHLYLGIPSSLNNNYDSNGINQFAEQNGLHHEPGRDASLSGPNEFSQSGPRTNAEGEYFGHSAQAAAVAAEAANSKRSNLHQNFNQFQANANQYQNSAHLTRRTIDNRQANQQHYSLLYYPVSNAFVDSQNQAQQQLDNQTTSTSSNHLINIVHPTISQRLINEQTRRGKQRGESNKGQRGSKMQSSSRQHLTPTPTSNHHHQQRHSGANSKRSPRKHQQQTPNKLASSNNGQPKPVLGFCGKVAKSLLFMANTLFWLSGIALGAWGILSLVDDHKYNLSQLLVFESTSRMSLFQLLSWSFITLGCATILVGFCGCSAVLKNNRWILGLYIFLILAIFALDLATGLLAIIFQERLVTNVRLRLANKLKAEYGVQASFTAAIDYIQTKYECCGLEGHFDYDQSLWRLQRLGGFEATVARTCCHLRNSFDDQAHINPRPLNESMCQSTDVRFHQSYRYRKGCLDDLERLVRFKIWNFTIGCAAVGALILISLFFATCFCRSIKASGSSTSASSRRSSGFEPDGKSQQHHSRRQQVGNVPMLTNQIEVGTGQQQHRHYR